MRSANELALLVYVFILFLLNFGPLTCIRNYLQHKPYGMQTLLDHVSINFSRLVQFVSGAFCLLLAFGLIFSPVDMTLARTLATWDFFTSQFIFSSFLTLTVVRYLSIFHGNFLETFEESTVVNVQQLISIGFGLISTYLNYVYTLGKSGYMFSILTDSQEGDVRRSRPGLFPVLVIGNLLMTLTTFIRVEYDGFKLKLRQWKPEEEVTLAQFFRSMIGNKDNYHQNHSIIVNLELNHEELEAEKDTFTIRIVVPLIFANVVIILLNFLFSKTGLGVATIISVNIFFISVLIPLIIIHRNEAMSKFSKIQLRRWIKCQWFVQC